MHTITLHTNDSNVKYNKATKSFSIVVLDFNGAISSVAIELVSHLTGAIETFRVDSLEAIENEFWDGEYVVMRPDNKKLFDAGVKIFAKDS